MDVEKPLRDELIDLIRKYINDCHSTEELEQTLHRIERRVAHPDVAGVIHRLYEELPARAADELLASKATALPPPTASP
ncbi:MAG: hypothetical protein ACK47B_19435 [Armatimonadota bacterium]